MGDRGWKGAARRGTTKGIVDSVEDAPFWGFVCRPVWQVALPMESLVGLARPLASLQALPFQVSYSLYCPYLCFLGRQHLSLLIQGPPI